jgi:hypothetical protein
MPFAIINQQVSPVLSPRRNCSLRSVLSVGYRQYPRGCVGVVFFYLMDGRYVVEVKTTYVVFRRGDKIGDAARQARHFRLPKFDSKTTPRERGRAIQSANSTARQGRWSPIG